MIVYTIYKRHDGSCGEFLNKEDADKVCEALNDNIMDEHGYDDEYCSTLTVEQIERIRKNLLKYEVVERHIFESAQEAVEWLKKTLPGYYENLKLKEK